MTEQTIAWYPLESNPEVTPLSLTHLSLPVGSYKGIIYSHVIQDLKQWAVCSRSGCIQTDLLCRCVGLWSRIVGLGSQTDLGSTLVISHHSSGFIILCQEINLFGNSTNQPSRINWLRQRVSNQRLYISCVKRSRMPVVLWLFYMHCWTIPRISSLVFWSCQLCNCSGLEKDSELEGFLQRSRDLTPEERGSLLSQQRAVAEYAKEVAFEGQTKTPAAEADVMLHFITFVNRDGVLYELDGDKPVPLSHGNSEDILKVYSSIVLTNWAYWIGHRASGSG